MRKSVFIVFICVAVVIFCCGFMPEDKEYKLGGFTTYYQTSTPERKHNIRLAASKLNGVVISSGEELSFNAIVGARTQEAGYKNAKIIVNGEYIEGTGGGVCQVSTTLYNAWVTAGLEVLSMAAHSLPSSYVALSRDAAVSSSTDLVLRNNTRGRVWLYAKAGEESLVIRVYGTEPQRYEYNLISRKIAEIKPSGAHVIERETDGITDTQYSVLSYGAIGYESEGILEKVLNGKIVERKVIRHDYYKAIPPKVLKKIPRQQNSQAEILTGYAGASDYYADNFLQVII